MRKAKLAHSPGRPQGQCTREEEPSFRNHRSVKIGMDGNVDDGGESAMRGALGRGGGARGVLDALAVRAEAAREGAEVHVVVIPREEATAVELFLERALVAEPAVVV